MATTDPVGELDARFGAEGAHAVPRPEAARVLDEATLRRFAARFGTKRGWQPSVRGASIGGDTGPEKR